MDNLLPMGRRSSEWGAARFSVLPSAASPQADSAAAPPGWWVGSCGQRGAH